MADKKPNNPGWQGDSARHAAVGKAGAEKRWREYRDAQVRAQVELAEAFSELEEMADRLKELVNYVRGRV